MFFKFITILIVSCFSCFISCVSLPYQKADDVRVTINPLEVNSGISKVAVFPFDSSLVKGSEQEGPVIADIYTTELLGAGYDCMERDQINKLLQEQSLNLSGAIDTKTAAEIGKMLGVEGIILGKVIGQTGNLIWTLKLVNVKTGRIVWSAYAVNASAKIIVKQLYNELQRSKLN